MKKNIKIIIAYLSLIRFWPLLLCLACSKNRNILIEDVRWWSKCYKNQMSVFLSLLWYLEYYQEFRNLFYYRIRYASFFSFLASPLPNLYLFSENIGKGLFLQHGFSTVLSAKSIGEYCWINQQVTLGWTNEIDAPTIGNNVKIYAGAIVIGNVHIGDNSIIGAGSTVVKDVPANSTVVGPAAKVIKTF